MNSSKEFLLKQLQKKQRSERSKANWANPAYRKQFLGKIPWNKIPNHKLKIIKCKHCKKKIKLRPCTVRLKNKKKYCSNSCKNAYRRGRSHKNWNPNSCKHSGYKTTKNGYYKGFRFKSSYELSALIKLTSENKIIKVEPFYIWYIFNGKKHRYFPDLLINKQLVVEIKPKSLVSKKINIIKQKAAITYCKKNKLKYELWTEDNLTLITKEQYNTMLQNKEIKPIIKYKNVLDNH